MIVKAEHNAQGPNPRFVVANVPGDPQELYEDVYCQRGEMENRIKEQQLGLFADRTSCHRFLANQFRLLLSSAAYVLVQALRRMALVGDGAGAGAGGDDPAEAVQGGGAGGGDACVGWCSTWPSSYPYQAVFRRVFARLMGAAAVARGIGLIGRESWCPRALKRGGEGEVRTGGPAARSAGLGNGDACL